LKQLLAWTFAAAVLMASPAAFAVQPDEIMGDPAKEARARDLSRELRCMVCQNQSIDDSEAPLARDLRLLVRERIAAGDSDAQVLDFLVARYGEFVLLKPRLEPRTLLLWLLGMLVLIPWVNRTEPYVWGLPFLLFWIVVWVALTSVCMTVIYLSDPANKAGAEQ